MIVRNVRVLTKGVEADVTLWSVAADGKTSQVTLHVIVHPDQDPDVATTLYALKSALHKSAQSAVEQFAKGQVPTP